MDSIVDPTTNVTPPIEPVTPSVSPDVTSPASMPSPVPIPVPAPEMSTTPAASPKSPVSLKWFLVAIAAIVILTGSILGILGANKPKYNAYTTTSQAVGSKWPYGTLPNVMLEKGTLRVDTDETTGVMSIHGNIVFAQHLQTGSECWVVWASTEPFGKVKTRVGTPFPKGNDQLNPPNPPCPHPGVFDSSSGYPAASTRSVIAPEPKENDGVLKNPDATPERFFDIYKIIVPKKTCKLYLNYRSNKQTGIPFYELTLPGCAPTPTPQNSGPTIPIGDAPIGCQSLKVYNTVGNNNNSVCVEFCGIDSNNKPCARGTSGCKPGACRAGSSNPYIAKQNGYSNFGSWHCCVQASCTKSCATSNDCSAGLSCLPRQCPSGLNCTAELTCQDSPTCSDRGTCQCGSQQGVYPISPTP